MSEQQPDTLIIEEKQRKAREVEGEELVSFNRVNPSEEESANAETGKG